MLLQLPPVLPAGAWLWQLLHRLFAPASGSTVSSLELGKLCDIFNFRPFAANWDSSPDF